jgi:hypothetical protein
MTSMTSPIPVRLFLFADKEKSLDYTVGGVFQRKSTADSYLAMWNLETSMHAVASALGVNLPLPHRQVVEGKAEPDPRHLRVLEGAIHWADG